MATAPPAPVASKGSAFGTVSLVFAALPIVVVLITGYELNRDEAAHKHDGWGGLGIVLLGAAAVVAVAGLSSLVGTVAGAVACARGEGHIWRPIAGLVVNAPVLLFVTYVVASLWGGR